MTEEHEKKQAKPLSRLK